MATTAPSTPLNKRPASSDKDDESAFQGSAKRRKQAARDVTFETLPAHVQQIIEQAAAQMNKSVQQLLSEGVAENDSVISGVSTSRSRSPSMRAPLSPHQAWSQAAQFLGQPESHDAASSTLVESTSSGLTIYPDQVSVDYDLIPAGHRWNSNSSHGLMPATPYNQQMSIGEHQPFAIQPPSWTLPGSIQHGQPGNYDTSEPSPVSSDQAAEASFLGSPSWEDVQIQSVAESNSALTHPGSLWLDVSRNSGAPDRSVTGYSSLINRQIETLHSPMGHGFDEANSPSIAASPSSVGQSMHAGDSPPEYRRQQSRKPFRNQTLRDETSKTRKLKACVRCRFQKSRCIIDEDDPSGQCKTCQMVSKQKLYTLPCMRYKITECTLYREGKAPGLEFTFRWPVMRLQDINKWSDGKVRTIKTVSDVCMIPFELHVRRFVPVPHDSLKRGWMDGKVKKFKETTPFAIVNMTSALKDMKEYIDSNVFECMKYFLQASDPLIKETYAFAIKHMERHKISLFLISVDIIANKMKDDEEGLLMGNYLRLWFAIRRTHTIEHIVSDDKLDMEPETKDKSFPLFGKVPLPPVMIQQLDMILILGILRPLRKRVLEDLQNLVLTNKPSSWLTIYLVTFMELHNTATISNESYRNARKHGLRRRYAMPNFISERHHSAQVFLSHYHYRTQPSNPFKLDWRRRQATPFSDMTPTEILFLQKTNKLVEEQRDHFLASRELELYEDDMFFISQLFEDDWQPRDTSIDFDDGTVNDVPLRQYV